MNMEKLRIHPTREFDNIREAVESFAEIYGDDTAFSFKRGAHDKEVIKKSFMELRDDVRALGSRLIELGVSG